MIIVDTMLRECALGGVWPMHFGCLAPAGVIQTIAMVGLSQQVGETVVHGLEVGADTGGTPAILSFPVAAGLTL